MPSITLTDLARMRVQTISFFLVCFLACSWAVQRIWNSLGRDFPRLPPLTFGKALGVVTLWGLLFVLVLTMISGARELMTPGAWRKDGLTYKLADGQSAASNDEHEAERRQALERLRIALWTYARGHGGPANMASAGAVEPVDDRGSRIDRSSARDVDPGAEIHSPWLRTRIRLALRSDSSNSGSPPATLISWIMSSISFSSRISNFVRSSSGDWRSEDRCSVSVVTVPLDFAAVGPAALGPVLLLFDFGVAEDRLPAPKPPFASAVSRPFPDRPRFLRILLVRLSLIVPSFPASRHASLIAEIPASGWSTKNSFRNADFPSAFAFTVAILDISKVLCLGSPP